MEDKYMLMKEILEKYKKGNYYEHKSNGWYEYEHHNIPKWEFPKEPTIHELLDMLEKVIQKHPRNLKTILDNLPEEEIQKYLRAKKMAKIKGEIK